MSRDLSVCVTRPLCICHVISQLCSCSQTANVNDSVKCKVNTDVYDFGGMKKLICVSELEDNLIHHLPNLYIEGIKGRKQFNVDEQQMQESLKKLLN